MIVAPFPDRQRGQENFFLERRAAEVAQRAVGIAPRVHVVRPSTRGASHVHPQDASKHVVRSNLPIAFRNATLTAGLTRFYWDT